MLLDDHLLKQFAASAAMNHQLSARRKNCWEDKCMWADPIVEEVPQVRDAQAAQHNYDLEAIYRALKAQEQQSERLVVTRPARRLIPPILVRADVESVT